MILPKGSLLQNGKYSIEKVLGQGGFGITYLATQVGLNRKVAIKEFFMKEYCNRDEATSHVSVPSVGSVDLVAKFRQKFIKEAQTIAEMENPHIVHIYDVFEDNGTAYYAMQFVDGGCLNDLTPFTIDEAVLYIKQIADALGYCHKRKILHLDVKPANILLKDNNAVLIDFGISKHYDDQGGQTSSTPVGISKGYAPLEQYNRSDMSSFTPSTDIYSLGATLYKLITGQTPPDANYVHENGIELPDHIPANIRNVITKAMEPRRKNRPQSIAEFIEILDGKGLRSQGLNDTKSQSADDEDTRLDVNYDSDNDNDYGKCAPIIASAPKTPETPKKKKSRAWIFILLAIIIGGAGYFVYEKKQEEYARTHGSSNVHDYVDLGLSVKWATCNVGANSPEDYGNYYSWGWGGEVKGSVLYDAARANWGGTWRLPTKAELEELENKCTWIWTTQKRVKGYKVTGPNGNSIFLPAAGFRDGRSLLSAGEYGYYWSSTPYESNSNYAYYLDFNGGHQGVQWHYRYDVLSVRPVAE